jgi:hypothetical protein
LEGVFSVLRCLIWDKEVTTTPSFFTKLITLFETVAQSDKYEELY